MNERLTYLDWLFASVIAVLLFLLLWGVTRPVHEPFTELYFEDFQNLPNESFNSVDFRYSIRNNEGVDVPFRVRYAVDYYDARGQALTAGERQNDEVQVSSGATIVRSASMPLSPPFERARISIELPGKDQSIHFWVRFTGNRLEYDNFGVADIECLDTLREVPDFSLITLAARAQFGGAWPTLSVLHNGQRIATFDVTSGELRNYSLAVKTQKDNIFEFIYQEDFYNRTVIGERLVDYNFSFLATDEERAELINQSIDIISEFEVVDSQFGRLWNITFREQIEEEIHEGFDRNVYISSVSFGRIIVPQEKMLIENGLPQEWFDCKDIQYGTGNLQSPGSLRLRVTTR